MTFLLKNWGPAALGISLLAGAFHFKFNTYPDLIGDLNVDSVPVFESVEDIKSRGTEPVQFTKQPQLDLLAFRIPASRQSPIEWLERCRETYNSQRDLTIQGMASSFVHATTTSGNNIPQVEESLRAIFSGSEILPDEKPQELLVCVNQTGREILRHWAEISM